MAYRSLVLPSATEKRVNNAIFQILGMAIKHYRHGMAFSVQIVEILEREESAVVPIAHGIRVLNDDFGIKSVLGNVLIEIIDRVDVNPVSQATSKHLSLFIAEIGEISFELSLQCLDLASDLLNLEVRFSQFLFIHFDLFYLFDINVNFILESTLNSRTQSESVYLA